MPILCGRYINILDRLSGIYSQVSFLSSSFLSGTVYGCPRSIISECFEMVIQETTHHVYTVPIRDDNSNITGGLLMTRDITDRKNAEISLGSRAQFLSILIEITRIVLETSNTQELIQHVVNLLEMMSQSDQCYITSWDDQSETTIPLAATGSMQTIYPTMVARTDKRTLTKSVLEKGQAIIINNLFNSPYISRSLAKRFPTRSMLAFPLLVDVKSSAPS